ncbi:hypothetical protein AZE42_05888 [Rhizopogon vesiculosus]|uniref:Uncharacterized protein n=1 Tax=Rhizopogon vesiculosus TaxID=180088 RepID=A0A1J8QXT1_9AGAM|nr:hypothetical protein AZE42_05888 [Rhizopogon vesiculosus]
MDSKYFLTKSIEHSVLIAVEWSREGGHSARLLDLLDFVAEGHETGKLADSRHHTVPSLQHAYLSTGFLGSLEWQHR